jgi:hypothetical protein
MVIGGSGRTVFYGDSPQKKPRSPGYRHRNPAMKKGQPEYLADLIIRNKNSVGNFIGATIIKLPNNYAYNVRNRHPHRFDFRTDTNIPLVITSNFSNMVTSVDCGDSYGSLVPHCIGDF